MTTTAESAGATDGQPGDVVELLLAQHMQIRDLFIEVEQATGEARLAEENQAKQALADIESAGTGHDQFLTLLAQLRESVLKHAHYEETYEFPALRATQPGQLRILAAAVRAAEKTAPTHPHPGAETAAENLAAGPVLAVFDRVKDAIRRAGSS